MLFERIPNEGLAHYSYLIGDNREALVIDPHRDAEAYLARTAQAGCRLAYILETHRNEDYVVGSAELAARTGAEVWHADGQLAYQYGQPAKDGQTWKVGRLTVQAIHTPGHTFGSMSYLARDVDGKPWVLFSGDTLFAGDVGRVDLPGVEHIPELAAALYDSVFNKLLPLGDELLLCPGHGAGSACGTIIAERPWTTIGIERQRNPRLRYTERAAFTAEVGKELERPPYFRRMEALNLSGAPMPGDLPVPLAPDAFSERMKDAIVLDTRSETAFPSAHVPGALSIWADGVPGYAGWLLPYDKPILLVNEGDDPAPVVRSLARIGYDHIAGYLAGGMLAWHRAGRESASTRTANVQQLCRLLDSGARPAILDVRRPEELEHVGRIAGAQHIHIAHLPERLNEVPRDRPVYVFCATGLRATIAASLLQRAGWEQIVIVFGGYAGWNSVSCPIRI